MPDMHIWVTLTIFMSLMHNITIQEFYNIGVVSKVMSCIYKVHKITQHAKGLEISAMWPINQIKLQLYSTVQCWIYTHFIFFCATKTVNTPKTLFLLLIHDRKRGRNNIMCKKTGTAAKDPKTHTSINKLKQFCLYN